jgi:hypothetical protein
LLYLTLNRSETPAPIFSGRFCIISQKDLTNTRLGFTKLVAYRMADELFDGQHEADAPAC